MLPDGEKKIHHRSLNLNVCAAAAGGGPVDAPREDFLAIAGAVGDDGRMFGCTYSIGWKVAKAGWIFGLAVLMASDAVASGVAVRKAEPVISVGNTWDAQAKFLAGIGLPAGSALAPFQRSRAYLEHAAGFEQLWIRYNDNFFTPMRAWSTAELAGRIPASASLIYFFGGPDALAAMAYYPDAPDYLLGGLEPVGSVPVPESLDPVKLEAGLKNLRESSDVILSYGHFITKDMKTQLESSEFRGVLPLLMAFVAMSGGEVLDVRNFTVRRDGKAVEGASAGRAGAPGVRVTFRRNSTAAPQRLHYVQADISDGGDGAGGVLAWAASFGRGNVYLKAASYLLHESSFSRIRKFLLENATSVLQDDSGIPLRYFQDGRWGCWFFGGYNGTLDIFKKYYQSDLEKAFSTAAEPLPFGTGYKWRSGTSNLLLAVPQAPQKAEPVSGR